MSKSEKKSMFKVKLRVAIVNKQTGKEDYVTEFEDPATVQFSDLVCANMLNTTETTCVKDTGGTSRTVSANSATSTVQVVAGTDTTAAAVTDYKLNAQSGGGQGAQTATANTVNTSTGVFTVTANMAAPASTIVYGEIGIYLTCATYVFCICRGTAGGTWSVDTSHYLAVTYTFTPS
jgi:hypothetical protein